VNTLSAWQNFYVIVGSSAGALTGLQFVVMALIADLPVNRGGIETTDAFGTPNIVHFGAVLLLSGIMSAPWHGIKAPAALLAICGACGLVYALLPGIAYAIWAGAAYAAQSRADQAFFAIGAASLLLLFVGIHNAWDAVTYMLFLRPREEQDTTRRP
jgi:hypothetical protein